MLQDFTATSEGLAMAAEGGILNIKRVVLDRWGSFWSQGTNKIP